MDGWMTMDKNHRMEHGFSKMSWQKTTFFKALFSSKCFKKDKFFMYMLFTPWILKSFLKEMLKGMIKMTNETVKWILHLVNTPLSTILSRCFIKYFPIGRGLAKKIPLLVSHEPFIEKFLNIVAWYNLLKLSRQVKWWCQDLILILYIVELGMTRYGRD